MSEETKTPRPPLFTGEPFERMMALLFALVTILAAVAALLEADAAAQTAQAIRRAQQYAMQAIGVKASGEVQAGYAWTEAYRRWLEWESLSDQAEGENDPAAADRYEAVRDRAVQLSPLLSEPYFNPETDDFPNIRAFEASNYLVENIILAERFVNTMELSGELEDKEKAYGTHLLLFAVALFLYGLSVTIVGRMRWLFVAMGTVMANIALIWMIITYITPITTFPDEAIVAYAEGMGFAHQEDYVAAIEAFDRALELVPGYANAYYARGNVYFDQGDFRRAATDYAAAMEAGREDVNVPWNLGWTYYVLGHLDDAIETTQIALELDDEQVALYFNLGLMHLAQGNLEEAQGIYAEGIDLATGQVTAATAAGEAPPASLWWYLGTAATDLDNFMTCLATQVCRETPPYDTIATADDVVTTTAALREQLKNTAVALEYLGSPSGEAVAATISEVEFGTPVYNEADILVGFTPLQGSEPQLRFGRVQEDQGEEVDVNIILAGPDEANEVFVRFNYDGLADSQLLTIKIYRDGKESPGLRLVENWVLGSTGEAALPLTPSSQFALAPGEYRVEIYVDAHLVQEGNFTIAGS